MIKNYGLIEPKIDENHYIEGDGRLFGVAVLKHDGDWTDYLPVKEQQDINFESYGCTCFGTTTQYEILHKFMFGIEPNYSDRFLYNLIQVMPPGADPQDAYEAVRRTGLIKEVDLPMTQTIEQYRIPRPVTDILKDKAKKDFKDIYFTDHDWVLTGTFDLNKLKTNLKYSPLAASVTAWNEENGLYVDNGEPNTHWTTIYKIDDTGIYVFDSYPPFFKKLSLNHNIRYAKRIVLYKKDPNAIHNSFLDILKGVVQLLTSYVALLSRSVGEMVGGVFSKRN